MNPLVHDSEAQFFGSISHGFGISCGDKADFDTCPHEQNYALPIAHIELLGFHPPVVEDDAAIRQHTVDVEQKQFYSFGLFSDRCRNALHGWELKAGF